VADAELKPTKVTDTTYQFVPKSDTKDMLVVEVGDSKQTGFYPQAKLMRWDNEVNLSVRILDADDTGVHADDGAGAITWEKGPVSARLYDVKAGEGMPEGGFEFEITLKEPPKDNTIQFSLQTKGLDFFYQPPLTEEEIKQGDARPDNVVGSYAVYYKDCPPNIEVTGKEYKAGKVCHIYRPLIVDADGNKVWGDLSVDEERGILTVAIDKDWLAKAVYPVTHAAGLLFGYDTQGASGSNYNTYGRNCKFTGVAGTAKSVSVYHGSTGGTFHMKGGIYNASKARLQQASATIGVSAGWQAITITDQAVTAADIWISFIADDYTDCYYDAGATGQAGAFTNDYANDLKDPMNEDVENQARKYSFYCTYTSSGTAYVKNIADRVGLGEFLGRLGALKRKVAEVLGLKEARRSGLAEKRGLAESVGLREAIGSKKIILKMVVDALGLREAVRYGYILHRWVQDKVGLADTVSNFRTLRRKVSEGVGVWEARQGRLSLRRFAAELLGIGEAAGRAAKYVRKVADGIGLREAATKATYAGMHFLQYVTESIGLRETNQRRIGYRRMVQEVVGIKEVVGRKWVYLFRLIAEGIGIREATGRGIGLRRIIGESVAVRETVRRIAHYRRNVSDGIGVREASVGLVHATQTLIKYIVEHLSISERVVRSTFLGEIGQTLTHLRVAIVSRMYRAAVGIGRAYRALGR
jgi:hypothetical protein